MAVSPGVPWSEVFGHEVTFAAPALFAEAMPHISPVKVSDAVLAHLLLVITGFATDRIEDAQVSITPDLLELLARIRDGSTSALGRVLVEGVEAAAASLGRCHAATLEAISLERRILSTRTAIQFSTYEALALGKAALGTPASLALAETAGFTIVERNAIARTLAAVALGMQYHDDVVDWEDDLLRDSSWAVLLAVRGRIGQPDPEQLRATVLSSGVLATMLTRSSRHFRVARRRAEALGARTLAAWAERKEENSLLLARHEMGSSGYAVRMHALSPWVAQVLS
ncbi:MAG TPA: hypothetical protein VJT73_09630 [Polyangiaceae bacterium]|nr:hypothetical protein [Polyangiaceae bacterium]